MPIYRIVVDAYNSRNPNAKPARVLTYSQGWNRAEAFAKLRSINIAADGTVSDGFTPWPGSRNLPNGPIQARGLPEWEIVNVRTVPRAGKARILAE